MADWPYYTKQWKRLREFFLRKNPFCVECRKLNKLVPAKHVDHITPISEGGAAYDERNLQGLCASCHSRKTATEDGGFGNPIENKLGFDENGLPLDPEHPWNR